MKKLFATGLILAASVSLAACNQNKAGNTSAAGNSSAAPAANASNPAPSGNSAAPAGGESADATNQNFTIRNGTGQVINELYVSAVSSNNWEEDILGRDTLANGESAQITFERSETQCQWDLRVVFENGQSLEERGVNLCQTAEIEVAP
jgi:hypothetical protein